VFDIPISDLTSLTMSFFSRVSRVAAASIVFAVSLSVASAALTPVNLRCSLRSNPLGIGEANPRLAWQLQSDGGARGETQGAWQIQAGSTPGGSDLWDSGKVAGSNTFDVLYGGSVLTSGAKCYWRVRVYDGSGAVSAWSTNAFWSMGLLNSNDWSAQWIGYDAAYSVSPQETVSRALYTTSGLKWISCSGQSAQGGVFQSTLRKRVVLAAGQLPTNAVMALYADNACDVYVNGQKMTNSAYRWEATARINVTPWLVAGTNVVGLYATSGDAQESAAVIGQLVMQFASGSVSNVPVDTSWTAAQWPAAGWALAGYDDSGWGTPNSGGTPWGTPSLNDIARVPAPYLRKSFAISQTVARATVYVTALGAYELHLNGQKVGNDVLTPGWPDFRKRVYYQTYDVTSLVQPGSNTVSAILGDGWYASTLAFKGVRLNYGGTPRLRAQMVIQYSDGGTQTIATDGSWKASRGPIQWGDLLLGSQYDARLEMPGWDTAGFNDGAWAPVVTGLSSQGLHYTNVTALVASYVANNQLSVTVNNATLGGDPAYGMSKVLQILYSVGGGTNQTATFAENATASLSGGGKTLAIVQALYGDPVAVANPNGPVVQAAVTEPARCLETLAATNLTQPAAGCYTFDLGQNMVGWVRLNLSGHVGDRITVRYGEMLNPNGTVYTANLRGATATDFYVFATNGAVVYEPRFTFHGFRYVEIRGLSVAPALNSVTGVVVRSDMARTGNFQCSDPVVNQLYSNIIWGQMGNYLEVPTDCPQRDERLGWSGDTEFFVPTAAYNFDVQSFFRRHMVTFCEDSQNSDGSYAHVAPDLGAGARAAAWQDAAWICPYAMYRAYGDTNIIADHYASFQLFGQYLASQASSYVISSLPGDFGDWLHLDSPGVNNKVIDTAFYAWYAQAMSEMAAAIGKTSDAATYAALRSNIAAAFAGFFNADGSLNSGSSQTAYALAFTLDLVPAGLRAQAAQQFANLIVGSGNHLATGFIGTPRLLPALHAAGRDDVAYTLLLQKTYPSWLYQVTLGATTMWERWDGWTPEAGFQTVGMNSFNHYSFGAVGEYLYSRVGGIESLSPGYRTLRVQPAPGNGLAWARASYNSASGLISTAWTNAGGVFKLESVIPPNTVAEVWVPTTNAAAITESGQPAASAPGVAYLGLSNGFAVFKVGSGDYVWSSPYVIPVPPGVVITSTNQTGASGVAFTPTWGMATNGSLLAGKIPVAVGSFSQEAYLGARSANSLTAGGSLTITSGGSPNTTSSNYVTCGASGGTWLVYTLTGSTNGYDLTNIVVYGGWGDNGRDQQAYTVYYSTIAAPSNFSALATVNFNPSIANNLPSATRVSIAHSTGVLASNVAALKFDFTNPSCENGYCGYAQLAAFGRASAPLPTLPVLLLNTQPSLANMLAGGGVTFSAGFGGSLPIGYQWQKISGGVTNPVPGAVGLALVLSNLQAGDSASYRLVASNAFGTAASSPAALTVFNLPAAVGNTITVTENQAGLGGNTFYPGWSVATNGSLIAGLIPDTAAGNFSREVPGRSVNLLTLDHDLSLAQIVGSSGYPITACTNYVTCGNGSGAGSNLIYILPSSALGYDLTNITVYGGWSDNGRDQQAYTVYCSSVSAPASFVQLASVGFNPAIAGGLQSATRVSLLPASGFLASNVAALKFDFTSPASENGYCGYGGIAVFGAPHVAPAVPVTIGAALVAPAGLVMNIGRVVTGRNYTLESTTNLNPPLWSAETNLVGLGTTLSITNSISSTSRKFFRVRAY
jgi:alpha-L-rhamnosidase